MSLFIVFCPIALIPGGQVPSYKTFQFHNVVVVIRDKLLPHVIGHEFFTQFPIFNALGNLKSQVLRYNMLKRRL